MQRTQAAAAARAPRRRLREARGLSLLVETHPRGRFLAAPMAAGVALYVLLTVTFAHVAVQNDALAYYSFLRRFLGEDVDDASWSRGFGSSLFALPFYLLARVANLAGLDSALGAPIEEVGVAAASAVAVVLALYLGWRLLVALDLPAGPAVLLLALFGTPLFYYAVFQPTYKHAVDALAFTLVASLLLRATERPSGLTLPALGMSLAFLISVRPANVAVVPGVLVALLLKRELRRAQLVLAATVVSAVALFALPVARGIPKSPPTEPAKSALVQRQPEGPPVQAAGVLAIYLGLCEDPGYKLNFWQCLHNSFGLWWDADAPAKMLFTVKRGLFLWTPLTALAALGAALLFVAQRRRRSFVAGLWLSAAGLLLAHWFWADAWTGGFSFSQRFLAALFPFYLLGTAELVRRWRRASLVACSLAAAFSLYVGFNHYVGYRGISERDGLDRVLESYTRDGRTPLDLARKVGHRALDRYGLR